MAVLKMTRQNQLRTFKQFQNARESGIPRNITPVSACCKVEKAAWSVSIRDLLLGGGVGIGVGGAGSSDGGVGGLVVAVFFVVWSLLLLLSGCPCRQGVAHSSIAPKIATEGFQKHCLTASA